MSADDLDETFPGLESVNGFYTPYYMQELFAGSVKAAAERGRACRRRVARRRDSGCSALPLPKL